MGAPGKETIASHRIAARFGLDPVRDVQVLCPMNRGGLGARALNLELQQALNPPGEVRVERLLGFIVRIDSDAGEVVVDFEGREVAYDVGELDEIVPAYATTVHKAQGSQYPAVVIPLVAQHYSMLWRNLVYTAITGASGWSCSSASPRCWRSRPGARGRDGGGRSSTEHCVTPAEAPPHPRLRGWRCAA